MSLVYGVSRVMNHIVVTIIFLIVGAFSVTGCNRSSGQGAQEPQPVAAVNPLANTTWSSGDALGGIGAAVGVYTELTLDFGETNVKFGKKTVSSGIVMESGSLTGTYTKSGDTVNFTFTTPNGEINGTATLIGNSLTFDDQEFRKVN